MTDTVASVGPVDAPTAEQIIEAFLTGELEVDLGPDQDLFASGALPSLAALRLVMFLERTFDLEISGEELTLANFRTVAAMAALVRRIGAAAPESAP